MTRTLHTIRLAAVLLMLSTGAVACSSSDGDAASTTTAPALTTPLAGTWRTASVSPIDAEATLGTAGLSEWIEEFRARAPFEDGTVLVLEIGDEWDLFGESDDGALAEIDFDASYEVDGDEVVVTHSAGSNTFRWEVAGDTLTLEHLESTMPAFEGVPEEVFQRALYMTAEFTRES